MKKKNNFEKKYPLFVKYFTDETIRKNMLENTDLLRKCENNFESIRVFIFELEKRFDSDTIKMILSETVLKYPDTILSSFITAYLNSDEATKSNSGVVSFYNKTMALGNEAIKYIEHNGIIANRKYKDLPKIVIDDIYNTINTGEEKYKDCFLDDVYASLTYPEREFVVELIESNSFDLLDIVFVDFKGGLKILIAFLINAKIDKTILNHENLELLEEVNLRYLAYVLMLADGDELLNCVHKLLSQGRSQLICKLISENLIDNLSLSSIDDYIELTDQEIIDNMKKNITVALKKED